MITVTGIVLLPVVTEAITEANHSVLDTVVFVNVESTIYRSLLVLMIRCKDLYSYTIIEHIAYIRYPNKEC